MRSKKQNPYPLKGLSFLTPVGTQRASCLLLKMSTLIRERQGVCPQLWPWNLRSPVLGRRGAWLCSRWAVIHLVIQRSRVLLIGTITLVKDFPEVGASRVPFRAGRVPSNPAAVTGRGLSVCGSLCPCPPPRLGPCLLLPLPLGSPAHPCLTGHNRTLHPFSSSAFVE